MADHKAEIDQHKQELLQNQKDGKGKWKGELSSNSEAAVCFFFLFLPFFWALHLAVNRLCVLGSRHFGLIELGGVEQIKADREETDAPEVNIAKLQKETSERAQSEHNKSK